MDRAAPSFDVHVVVAAWQHDLTGSDPERRCREVAFLLAGDGATVTVLVVGGTHERSSHRFGETTVLRVPLATRGDRLRRSGRHAAAALARRLAAAGSALRTSLEEFQQRQDIATARRRAARVLLAGVVALRRSAGASGAGVRSPRPQAADPEAARRTLAAELRVLGPDAVHAVGGVAARAARDAQDVASFGLLDDDPAAALRGDDLRRAHRRLAPRPLPASRAASRRLLVGPRNGNGQAWAWAQAVEARAEDVEAIAVALRSAPGTPQQDVAVDVRVRPEDWGSRRWSQWWAQHVLGHFTHVLMETGWPALGRVNGDDAFADLPVLREHGLRAGLIFRGSELRDPRAHAARERHSPFADPRDPLTARLQEGVDRLHAQLAGCDDVPCFVTTLDLLDDLPRAQWLPHVLDLERWAPGPPILRRRCPVVVHAPTRESLKGSRAVDAACESLAAAGRIEYRRLRAIAFTEMPAVLRAADVLVDQVVDVGSYGALSLQAMATGRLVVANVSDRVRGRLSAELPIVQATPDTLDEVLEDVIARRADHAALAAAGRRHAERFHSGAHSAGTLLAFLSG